MRTFSLLLGPAVAMLFWLSPAPADLNPQAWAVAGLVLWMAVWWFSEALPLPATALLPLVVIPLIGVSDARGAAAPYAHPVIFLFLGGFLIARAIQERGLSRRLALWMVQRAGGSPTRTVWAFFIVAAVLSLWVNNTSTALMLLPIAKEVLAADEHDEGTHPWAVPLLLAVAYGCNIGGMGTVIGTAPNALTAAFLSSEFDLKISFVEWLAFGLPLVISGVVIGSWLLTRVLFRVPSHGGLPKLATARSMTSAERRTALVALVTALAWLSKPLLVQYLPGLHDAQIAITGAVLMFAIPRGGNDGNESTGRLLNWDEAVKLPWGVLLLFGGGLSLASAIQSSGLAQWLGLYLQFLQGVPVWLIVASVALFILMLTEFTSNTATTAAFLPIVGALATAIDLPAWQLLVPLALAASGAFMMPVATPPNAIVFGGEVTIRHMVRTGVWFNALFVTLITLVTVGVLPRFMAA